MDSGRGRRLHRAAVLVAVVSACGALAAGAAATGKPRPVGLPAPPTISPLPGTPDASPDTQISILGIPRGLILGVRVVGSDSGLHRGRLHAYSSAPGASFVLDRRLDEGEQVTVVVALRGRRAARSRFTVARLALTPPVINITKEQPGKLDHFASDPGLLAPRVTVRGGASRSGGDIFLTPLPAPIVHPESNNELTINPVGPGGPMIVNRRGRLIWFHRLTAPTVATDLELQRLNGRSVLTWWQGRVTAIAYGLGEGVIADTHYRVIATVRTGNGYQADLHEFELKPDGQALFTIDSPVLVHLAGSAPGALSPLLDSIVQEVDVQTGLVMWEWHSFGHIPLADSYATPSNSLSYDAFHLDSIQTLSRDRLLVSARDTSAIYEIDRRTGRILWTLGGKASTFRLARGARFYFQHDARMLSHGRLSLFDDGAGPPVVERSSRGLILALNSRRRLATVVRQYVRPGHDTSAESEGDVQVLPAGGAFVGFGATPYFSQFTASGRLLFDGALPVGDGSYRALLFRWRGTPVSPPVAVARRSALSRVTIYVSWNGATSVARWRVLGARGAAPLRPLANSPDRAFETRITVRTRDGRFELQALGARGQVLGRSAPVAA